MKVLEGIRIVEQGTFITGPCAAMLLADLGADVIKLESPGNGDPYRSFRDGYYSAHFQAYNRNKRSISIDMKNAEDHAVFSKLVGSADVYIQNFRPGAAQRMGADSATLQSANPGLVYCSISGFGQSGPYVARPSYDSVTQALSGFLGVAIDPASPRLLGPALADAVTGYYAALGIMGALIERGRTGKGRLLEISMLEAMMHFAVEPFTGYFALGDVPTSLDRPRLAQAYIARCGDGKLIGIHMSSIEKFWTNLVAALDAPQLAQDPRFRERQGRIDNYEALLAEMNAIFSRAPRESWVERMAGFDLPFGPVNSIPEAVADPQARHLEMVVPIVDHREGAIETIRPPFNFDGQHAQCVKAPPTINEDGDAIRDSLCKAPDAWPAPVRHPVEA